MSDASRAQKQIYNIFNPESACAEVTPEQQHDIRGVGNERTMADSVLIKGGEKQALLQPLQTQYKTKTVVGQKTKVSSPNTSRIGITPLSMIAQLQEQHSKTEEKAQQQPSPPKILSSASRSSNRQQLCVGQQDARYFSQNRNEADLEEHTTTNTNRERRVSGKLTAKNSPLKNGMLKQNPIQQHLISFTSAPDEFNVPNQRNKESIDNVHKFSAQDRAMNLQDGLDSFVAIVEKQQSSQSLFFNQRMQKQGRKADKPAKQASSAIKKVMITKTQFQQHEQPKVGEDSKASMVSAKVHTIKSPIKLHGQSSFSSAQFGLDQSSMSRQANLQQLIVFDKKPRDQMMLEHKSSITTAKLPSTTLRDFQSSSNLQTQQQKNKIIKAVSMAGKNTQYNNANQSYNPSTSLQRDKNRAINEGIRYQDQSQKRLIMSSKKRKSIHDATQILINSPEPHLNHKMLAVHKPTFGGAKQIKVAPQRLQMRDLSKHSVSKGVKSPTGVLPILEGSSSKLSRK